MLTERLKSAIPLILIVCLTFFGPAWLGGGLFPILAAFMLYLAAQEAFELLAPNFKFQHRVIFTVLAEIMLGIAVLRGVPFPPGNTWQPYAIRLIQTLPLLIPALIMGAILLAFLITFAHEQNKETVHGVLASIGIFAFILWPLTYLIKIFYLFPITGNDNPRILLFYIILITKMADVGAYFAGSQLAKRRGGNHCLSPLVSPKKSWEGLLGGIALSLLASLVFVHHYGGALLCYGKPIIGYADAVILAILAAVLGLLGDLAESSLKRAAGAKDSGQLPGIGGILDTLDSLLPMGPLFYAYVMLKLAIC